MSVCQQLVYNVDSDQLSISCAVIENLNESTRLIPDQYIKPPFAQSEREARMIDTLQTNQVLYVALAP